MNFHHDKVSTVLSKQDIERWSKTGVMLPGKWSKMPEELCMLFSYSLITEYNREKFAYDTHDKTFLHTLHAIKLVSRCSYILDKTSMIFLHWNYNLREQLYSEISCCMKKCSRLFQTEEVQIFFQMHVHVFHCHQIEDWNPHQ